MPARSGCTRARWRRRWPRRGTHGATSTRLPEANGAKYSVTQPPVLGGRGGADEGSDAVEPPRIRTTTSRESQGGHHGSSLGERWLTEEGSRFGNALSAIPGGG